MNSFQQSGILEALSQPWEGRTYMPASESRARADAPLVGQLVVRLVGGLGPRSAPAPAVSLALNLCARQSATIDGSPEIGNQDFQPRSISIWDLRPRNHFNI
jgi:hypothetical protein